MSERDEQELFDAFVREARGQLDVDIAAERRLVVPDFAAMVAAAHERDPDAVSAAAVAEADSFAPVVELGHGRMREGMLSEEALEQLLEEARALAEADVRQRRLAGIPPLRVIPSAANDGGRLRWLAPVMLLAAVFAGLALVGPRLIESLATSRGGGSMGVEAEYFNQREGVRDGARVRQGGLARAPEPEAQRVVAADAPPAAMVEAGEPDAAEPDAAASEPTESEPTESEPTESEPRAKARERASKQGTTGHTKRESKLEDRVALLDAEAQACWARGDLDGATQSFRQILAIAGKSRYADLAYGDLFTIARQRRDRAAEAELWAEYLQRFPRGRFAQDARAGSCRRVSAGEATACWSAYVEDFPGGVHLREAERALGEEPAP